MTVAITGASGGLGRRVAELLLNQMLPADLLLLTRTPDDLKDLAKRGVDVRKASFKNPTGLKADLQGVERLLMISADAGPKRLELQRQAVAVAKTAGVEHVVYTSMAQPSSDNPSFVVPDHAATEQALRESGMAWTFLRNNLYAEVAVSAAEAAIRAGKLVTNAGDGGTAYVSRHDCARAAAAVLATDGHEKTAYDITGPQAVTQAELASMVAEVTGESVELVGLPDDAYFDHLLDAGVPQEVADVMSSFGEATREGFLGKVSTDVADLTGKPPAALRDVLERALKR
ncbi:MAG: SDR family oxidoreductase [Solirubrobacteraceae bacterium]|nr:SDR family oxidoreductase [Solirubrobacteraceae bacterium]